MGLVYSKSESLNVIQAMEGNLTKAETILGLLTSASQKLTGVLDVELKGKAYSSGLAVFDDIIFPTMKNARVAIEELSQGLTTYRHYDNVMPNEVLDEDNLNEQIRIRRNMVRSLDYHIRLLQQDGSGDNLVSQTNLVNDLYAHISTVEHEIRLLQEKLRKLGEFSSRTSGLFSKGSDYLQGVLRGVNVLNHASVNPKTGTYILTGGVSLFDLYVPKEGDDFYSKLQKMSLAEIEELFGGRIKGYQAYTQTGYGLTIKSGEDWEQLRAILARYRYLKSIGDPSLAHVTMLSNLDPADKSKIDKLTLQGIMNYKVGWFGTGITLLRGPYMGWQYMAGSPQDRAKFDYLYYRFNQLMAEQPIDWRDPDFATKYAAYIKKTGRNPFTGKKATPGEQAMAKYYGPAKGISQGLAIASLLVGPKVMSKFGQLKGRKVVNIVVDGGYKAPTGGGGVTSTVQVGNQKVDFGHGGRHLSGTNLKSVDVNKAIAVHVSKNPPDIGRAQQAIVNVNGIDIVYRAYKKSDGTINIGTYFPKNSK